MVGLAALCFVWAGMVLGISFLETPVKFTAPSVTLLIGLDVGRHVFGALNKVEIGTALIACGLLLFTHPQRVVWLLVSVAVLIVTLQTIWLLPVLDARVEMLFHHQVPPPSLHHALFAGLELLKVICLLAAGMAGLQSLKRTPDKQHEA